MVEEEEVGLEEAGEDGEAEVAVDPVLDTQEEKRSLHSRVS